MVGIRVIRSLYKWWFLPVLVLSWHFLGWAGLSGQLYKVYSGFLYPLVRGSLGFIAFRMPFPLLYVLIIVLFGFVIFKYRLLKHMFTVPAGIRVLYLLLYCCKMMVVLVSLFYITWAFNYYRPSIETELKLPASDLSIELIQNEFQHVTKMLNQQRDLLSTDTNAYVPSFHAGTLSDKLNLAQTALLSCWNMPAYAWIRVKPLYPDGMLMRFSTAGFYMPLTGEGYIDAGLHSLQWPFTMAHEMAHVQGHTDEGTCNFIGLLTCLHSNDADIHYSGLLSYWGYLYRQLLRLDDASAKEIRMELSPAVTADFTAIRKKIMDYPDIFPRFRNLVYDTYLRSHGVQEGLQSYDGIVALMIRWRQSDRAFPITPVRE